MELSGSADEPQYPALVTQRLILLPLTFGLQAAYRAVNGDSSAVTDGLDSKSFKDVVFTSVDPNRRSYAIFLASQIRKLAGKVSYEEQKQCVGAVGLIGHLVPTGRMRDDDIGPRQFEWRLFVHIRKDVRRRGFAREACEAAMQSLAESDMDIIKGNVHQDLTKEAEYGRDISFVAIVSDKNAAAMSLTGQLGYKEVGYSSDGRSTSIIKTKPVVRCLLNAQDVYGSVREVDSTIVPRPCPWDRYWMPKPLVADHVVLLPMTSNNYTAYEAVASASQCTVLTGFSHNLSLLCNLPGTVPSDASQDRRFYGVFKLTDLIGLPSDMKATESQERKCIGLVSLTGQLIPVTSSSADDRRRRFNWELDVIIIPGERQHGYGKDSARAAIKALFEEGAGDFDQKDFESHNRLKRPQFGVKGSQGLGEEVLIIARFEENNIAAKALLNGLGFRSPNDFPATEERQMSEESKTVFQSMVKPVGELVGNKENKKWVWAIEPKASDTKHRDPDHWWRRLWC